MRSEPLRVAIDLETTGLRPEQDAIIEIGAVKFAGPRIVDTFQSFVSINSPLPYRIHRLTGISAADLRGAPALSTLLPPLRAFIGSAPLVGHSVSFDASFLRKVGVARRNPLIDTYELASMLLPGLTSYTLGSVANALSVSSSIHHRALADADLARAVFLALMDRLDALDTRTLTELAALPAPAEWTPGFLVRGQTREREEAVSASPFAKLLTATQPAPQHIPGIDPSLYTMAVALDGSSGAIQPSAVAGDMAITEDAHRVSAPSIQRERGLTPEAMESLERFLQRGGALALEVERTEAALLALLEQIALWAATSIDGTSQAAAPVIIAAADGDQMTRLARTLIPLAAQQAGLSDGALEVAELDEHEAYLCLHRWFGVARDGQGQALTGEVTRGLAKLTVWARDTRSGRRADAGLSGIEGAAWERVRSGPDFGGSTAECPYRSEGYCFVARDAQRAAQAAIVVTTHAALAAHLSGRDTLLPEASRVIALEGRLLEDELRRQQTFTLDAGATFILLDTLGQTQSNGERAGLLRVAARLAPDVVRADERRWLAAVSDARVAATNLFMALRSALQEGQERGGRADDGGSLRVAGTVAGGRAWERLRDQWSSFASALGELAAVTEEADEALANAQVAPVVLGARADLRAMAQRLKELIASGNTALARTGAADHALWLRAPQTPFAADTSRDLRARRGARNQPPAHAPTVPPEADALADAESSSIPAADVTPEDTTEEGGASQANALVDAVFLAEAPSLTSAPAQVGRLLAPLWAPGRGLALVGWALSVAGDFECLRGSLALPQDTAVVAATPDYSSQTLLCLPADAPEPAASSYHGQLESLIVALARALSGDLVVIFPSHAALRTVANGVRRALERFDILALAQGMDGSARQLWQTFNDQPRTVLLGAGAFWDGAEQRGRPPACILVARTPFPPQSDPLVAARAEQWADPQNQFMTPQAALKLRQALGGLAWSHTRRNAVVLYDRRLQNRGYGPTIIGALPQCEQYLGSAADLPERIAEWVDAPVRR